MIILAVTVDELRKRRVAGANKIACEDCVPLCQLKPNVPFSVGYDVQVAITVQIGDKVGIDRVTADELLTFGFFEEVLSRLKVEWLHERLGR